MAVLIRTTEEVHDTRVATSTVVGMVLGVLSLFVLIVTYQFLPRRASSRPRAVSALAPPPPKPRPLVVRIRTRCSTLLNSIFRKRQTPTTEPAQPGHRTMRSFHLTPERRREREHNRLKFAKSLRIKIDLPPFPHVSLSNTPASTPRPPKRAYSRMRDSDDGYECLLKPESTPHTPLTPHTPHTPRSPPDYPSPTSPPPRFRPFASPMPFPGSPPPLYPPPPAYVPRTNCIPL
ncbi:uncharacterized protein PHACADRAFT_214316 [Phanerochaete carnosa HHB-10118-sp]|uniref:Uncharacterized protein n=1 Tax=Phanerochaete carnosa (strain HHB-10118-sp) TaxID=650164 RepID=K5VF94_PHACS|nr:uncharacterized protein PHACADRAFT_214316 [Phanerochaete carnosa HHB-10118-sp]EKM49793.1 hypothetical protein PHACADRAFT_214316 [Phanerochaete carnosa HHB-10118-sp]